MVNATAVTNESETTQQFRTWAAAAQIQWLQEARADLEQNPHDEVRALLVLETAKIIVTDETRRDISKQGQKAYYYRGSERIEAFRCPQPLHYPDVLHEGMKTLHQAIKNTPSLPQRDINILSKNVANTLTLIKNEREGTPAYASADNFIAGYALLEELSKRIQLEPREENPPKAAQKSRRFFSILSRQEPEKIVDDDLDYSLVARTLANDALFYQPFHKWQIEDHDYEQMRAAAQQALLQLLTMDGSQIEVVQKAIAGKPAAPGAAAVQAIISSVYPEKDTRYRPLPDWLEDSFRGLKEKDRVAEALPSADVAPSQAIAHPVERMPAAAQPVTSEAKPQQQHFVATSSLMHIRFQEAAEEVGVASTTKTVSAPVFEVQAAADNSITLSGGLQNHIVPNLSEEQYFAALENAAVKPSGVFVNLVPLQEANRQRHGNQSPQP